MLVGPNFSLFPVKYEPDYVRYFAGEFRVVSVGLDGFRRWIARKLCIVFTLCKSLINHEIKRALE